ncbi:MAG: hypothetical protein ACJ8DZ_08605 [Allosphingosinicella sp.]
MRGKILGAAAAVALLTSSTMASAQQAAPVAPAAEHVQGSELNHGFILPLIAIIAIIIAIILLTDNNDTPKSP